MKDVIFDDELNEIVISKQLLNAMVKSELYSCYSDNNTISSVMELFDNDYEILVNLTNLHIKKREFVQFIKDMLYDIYGKHDANKFVNRLTPNSWFNLSKLNYNDAIELARLLDADRNADYNIIAANLDYIYISLNKIMNLFNEIIINDNYHENEFTYSFIDNIFKKLFNMIISNIEYDNNTNKVKIECWHYYDYYTLKDKIEDFKKNIKKNKKILKI